MSGHISGVWVPIVFWIVMGLIVIIPRFFQNRERLEVQNTVRAAIEKGQPMPPELIEAIARDARPAPSPQRDIRAGVIWVGVAVGLLGIGAGLTRIEEAHDAWPILWGVAAFPGFIGVAFVVMGLVGLATSKRK